MAARDITPERIRTLLEAMRQARPFESGALADLHLVRERLRRAGSFVSPADVEWALGDVIVETVCRTLGQLGVTAPPLPAEATPDEEWRRLREDWAERSIECQAWSCLYLRYVSHAAPSIARIADEVGGGSAGTRVVQRRIARGIRRLAHLLRDAEWRLAEAAARRHNLPRPADSTIGRREERAQALAHLEDTRLLTFVGTGGIGKTRLALEVAHAAIGRYLDGVWWVELAPLGDAEGLYAAIAAATDVRLTGRAEPGDEVVTGLRARQLLLVLDNCEHLASDVAAAAQRLLGGCARVSILATSRRSLGARGETILEVPPLGLPDAPAAAGVDAGGRNVASGSEDDPAPAVLASEAGALFVARAAAVDAGWRAATPHPESPDGAAAPGMPRRSPEDWASVAKICRRLDGIPLAIEMAAARLRALSVRAVDEGLDDGLRLLTGGIAHAQPRHAAMSTVIDWSWRLLGAPEQRLLARLSVFRGSFTLVTAASVCGQDGDAPAALRDRLARLVDASLVVRLDGERQRLLEPVRSFAAERLEAAGEREALRDRHLAHFTAWVRAGRRDSHGGEPKAWFDALALELTELDHALAWALETSRTDEGAALCDGLIAFWDTRGHYRPAARWTTALLDEARGTSPPAVRAMLLRAAAIAAGLRGRHERRRGLAHELLAVAEELDDDHLRAEAHRQLGGAHVFLGEMGPARAHLEIAVALRRGLDDEALLADDMLNLAVVHDMQGDFDEALRGYEEAQSLYRRLGHLQGLCKVIANRAALLESVSRYDEAFELWLESRDLAIRIGLRSAEAVSLQAVGAIHGQRGEHERAQACNEAALQIFREIGDPRGELSILNNLANACVIRGDGLAAIPYLEWSCHLIPIHPDIPAVEFVLGTAAKLLMRQGRLEACVPLLVAGIEIHRGRPYQHQPQLRNGEERLARIRGQLDEARFAELRDEGLRLSADLPALLDALRRALRDLVEDEGLSPYHANAYGARSATQSADVGGQ